MKDAVYKLIELLSMDNLDGLPFSVHNMEDITCVGSYRVYTSEGYAFNSWCEENDGILYYGFLSLDDGFKPITSIDAVVYLQKNGVFV